MAKRIRCKAKNRAGGQCKRYVKLGSDKKVCYYHGGNSPGAPKENKNALVTGERETIYIEALCAEDQAIFNRAGVDSREELDHEIRLITFRIRRMLFRVENLKDEFFVSEKVTTAYKQQGDISYESQGLTKTESSALEMILRIEEAITRQQKLKASMLETKHKLGQSDGGDDTRELMRQHLADIGAAGMIEEAWADEDEQCD